MKPETLLHKKEVVHHFCALVRRSCQMNPEILKMGSVVGRAQVVTDGFGGNSCWVVGWVSPRLVRNDDDVATVHEGIIDVLACGVMLEWIYPGRWCILCSP